MDERAALLDLIQLIDREEPDWGELCTDRGTCRLVTFVNPQAIACQRRQPAYLDLLEQFDSVFADGMLLAFVASHVRGEPVERLSFDGNSIATKVFDVLARSNTPVAIIGGKEGVAAAAAEVLRGLGVTVAYTRSGYFVSDHALAECLRQVGESGAKVVIAGMGIPHQERFLLALKASRWTGTAFSCGGYLDQLVARGVYYYPHLINSLNLRWLYRVYREPRRLLSRYVVSYLPFYVSALRVLAWRKRVDAASSVSPLTPIDAVRRPLVERVQRDAPSRRRAR